MRGRGCGVYCLHNGVVLMRASHREHVREGIADALVFHAETACYDHAPVLGHRLADCFETFGLRRYPEIRKVYNHNVRPVIAWRNRIPLRAQTG